MHVSFSSPLRPAPRASRLMCVLLMCPIYVTAPSFRRVDSVVFVFCTKFGSNIYLRDSIVPLILSCAEPTWPRMRRYTAWRDVLIQCVQELRDTKKRRQLSRPLDGNHTTTGPVITISQTSKRDSRLVAWYSGRTSVSDRQTFPVLCSTCR